MKISTSLLTLLLLASIFSSRAVAQQPVNQQPTDSVGVLLQNSDVDELFLFKNNDAYAMRYAIAGETCKNNKSDRKACRFHCKPDDCPLWVVESRLEKQVMLARIR